VNTDSFTAIRYEIRRRTSGSGGGPLTMVLGDMLKLGRMTRLAISLSAGLLMIGALPAHADVKDGVDAWSRGDYDTAVAQWQGPAAKGDPDAMFNMGSLQAGPWRAAKPGQGRGFLPPRRAKGTYPRRRQLWRPRCSRATGRPKPCPG
jgi:hypothetical protein